MASIFHSDFYSRNKPEPRFNDKAARLRIAALTQLVELAAQLGHPFESDEEYGGRIPQDEIEELQVRLTYGPFREPKPIDPALKRKIQEKIIDQRFQSAAVLGILRDRLK